MFALFLEDIVRNTVKTRLAGIEGFAALISTFGASARFQKPIDEISPALISDVDSLKGMLKYFKTKPIPMDEVRKLARDGNTLEYQDYLNAYKPSSKESSTN